MATFRIPFIDASGENSSFQVNVDDAINDGDLTTLFDAIIPLTIAGAQQSALVTSADKDGTNSGKPTNKLAQRENKFLFIARNAGGDVITRELPCADLTETDSSASNVDLDSGDGLAMKTAWDAHVTDDTGGATTLEEIRFVGRNL